MGDLNFIDKETYTALRKAASEGGFSPVIYLPTGEVFPSVGSAAKVAGWSDNKIREECDYIAGSFAWFINYFFSPADYFYLPYPCPERYYKKGSKLAPNPLSWLPEPSEFSQEELLALFMADYSPGDPSQERKILPFASISHYLRFVIKKRFYEFPYIRTSEGVEVVSGVREAYNCYREAIYSGNHWEPPTGGTYISFKEEYSRALRKSQQKTAKLITEGEREWLRREKQSPEIRSLLVDYKYSIGNQEPRIEGQSRGRPPQIIYDHTLNVWYSSIGETAKRLGVNESSIYRALLADRPVKKHYLTRVTL